MADLYQYNVKLFGALGNGIADDTVAIQNTINAIPQSGATPGGVVYFPQGVYKTTGTLDLTGKANIGLRMEKEQSTQILCTNSTAHIIAANNPGPSPLGALSFDRVTLLRSPASTTHDALRLQFVELFSVDSCHLSYSRYGLYLASTRMGDIISPVIGTGNQIGLYMDTGCQYIATIGGWWNENAQGVNIINSGPVNFFGTNIIDGFGMEITASQVFITGSYIEGQSSPFGFGVKVYGSGDVRIANSGLRGVVNSVVEDSSSPGRIILTSNLYFGPVSLQPGSIQIP